MILDFMDIEKNNVTLVKIYTLIQPICVQNIEMKSQQ